METLSYLLDSYFAATNENSIDAQTIAIRRISQAHKFIISLPSINNATYLEKSYSFSSQSGVQDYYLPINMRIPKAISVVSGGVTYTPTEVSDPEKWNQMNVIATGNQSDSTMFYHLKDNRVSFFPKFATNNAVINLDGVKKQNRNFEVLDYKEGSVSVTNNSNTVTGASTNWQSTKIKAGASIFINDIPYEILTRDSTTQLTLAQPYQGSTATGQDYKIGDTTFLPDGFDDLVWLRAAREFYRTLENTETKRSIYEDYKEMLDALERFSYSKTTSNVIPRFRQAIQNPNNFPRNIG